MVIRLSVQKADDHIEIESDPGVRKIKQRVIDDALRHFLMIFFYKLCLEV